jgi:hypothetical protein
MSKRLDGLRVLLLHPGFFLLGQGAASGLAALGADVTSWCTRPWTGVPFRAGLRIAPSAFQLAVTAALEQWLYRTRPPAFDLVLAVDGEGLSAKAIHLLRDRNPRARFLLYLADSVRNSPLCLRRAPAFDEVLSFDRADCDARPRWRYRPLFATREYWSQSAVRGDRGVSFVGSFHPERLEVLRKWTANCRTLRIEGEYLLATRGSLDRLRWLRGPRDADIAPLPRPLSAERSCAIYRMFGTVLDIHHPGQSGLTMRTVEALAAGCRLVTTNRRIMDEEFFDPDRISVIDRHDPLPDSAFLRAERHDVAPPLDGRFTVEGWAEEVVGV